MAPIAAMDTTRSSIDIKGFEVQMWLTDTVGRPEYVDTFISNGFETLKSVMAIDRRELLGEIGITLTGHQLMIWKEIKALKQRANNKEGTVLSMKYTVSNTFVKSDIARLTRL